MGGAGDRSTRRNDWRRRALGDLAVEVDQIAGEEAGNLPRPGAQLGEGACGDKLGLSSDGELGFEAQEGPFGEEIRFPLLSGRGAGEPVGDVGPDGGGSEHHRVRKDLGLPPDARADRPDDVATEGDGFLPDSELAQA
jgi:hypothetical protein